MSENNLKTEESEGQLSIDVYQDEFNIYIVAPIAGVKASDIDLSITEETITIHGVRKPSAEINADKYLLQECYWGKFSRSYKLPIPANAENSKATLKDGLLTIEVPKDEKAKTRIIKVSDK